MTVIRILIAATLMTPVLATAQAQTAPSPEWPVSAGSYVRIESSVLGSGFHKGNVVNATSDTLVFQPKADAPAMSIATPNIVRLEVAGAQKTHKARGALIGFLIGAGTGAVLGAASGGIVGATVDLAEFGLSEDFIDDVSTQLNPGETALIAEVGEGSTESIDRIVALHGGRVYRSELV